VSYSVKELFYLQGAGANTERPAVFCRFSGCNLWTGRTGDRAGAVCQFCDTVFVGRDGTGAGGSRRPVGCPRWYVRHDPRRLRRVFGRSSSAPGENPYSNATSCSSTRCTPAGSRSLSRRTAHSPRRAASTTIVSARALGAVTGRTQRWVLPVTLCPMSPGRPCCRPRGTRALSPPAQP